MERFSKLAEITEKQPIKKGQGHVIAANPEDNRETLKNDLSDDYSLAGHCVTPNATSNNPDAERKPTTMDRPSDMNINQPTNGIKTNQHDKTSNIHQSIQKQDVRRTEEVPENEKTSFTTNSEIMVMEDNVAYAGFEDKAN